MATAVLSLDSITVTDRPDPPRIVIHGVHGVGKTTFAAAAPNPVFIWTEKGKGKLRVPGFPIAKSYEDVIRAMRVLMGEHSYRTLVIDSLDWLEPLIWQATALEYQKTNIEDFGYGKGYTYADERWKELLNALTILSERRGMTVVCIAHTEIKRYDAPDTEPYDRYCIKLHKRAAALVDEWADVVGFARWEVHTEQTDVGFNKKVTRGIGTGERRLALEERPAFEAKNRYGLPAEIALDWSALREQLRAAFNPTPAEPSAPAAPEPTTSNGAEAPHEEAAHV
jgi:hypothetical protein